MSEITGKQKDFITYVLNLYKGTARIIKSHNNAFQYSVTSLILKSSNMKAMPIISGLAALTLIFLTLPSCKKEPGNNSGLSLKVQATNRTYSIPAPDNNGSQPPTSVPPSVNWETAQMFVSEVKLEAEKTPEGGIIGQSNEIELFWQGPKLIDLFNLNETLGRIQLPPGRYDEIEIQITARKSDAGNHSVFYLSGTYTNISGETFPLIVDITDDLSMTSEKEDVTIPAGTNGGITEIVEIYLNKLFSHILPDDLDKANMVDGKIIISASYNQDLYYLILENLQKSDDSDNDD